MKDDPILPIIFTVALSIGIALFAYFLLIHFMVNIDLQDSFDQKELVRVNNLLNFYEDHHEGDIFIIGSSQVREGIDAYVVQDLLQKKSINRSVYVLAINSDVPLERVTEVDNIITSRPKMVVIGLSYRDLGSAAIAFWDRMLLTFQRKQINERKQLEEEFKSFLNDDELKFISQTPFERLFYNRKFLFGPVDHSVRGLLFNESFKRKDLRGTWPDLYVTNFKDPWICITNQTEAEKNIARGNGKNIDLVSEDLNPQKKALLYTINRLQQNNISVIIINLPLDPHYSSIINESSRHNLSNFLNSTGVPWYNYEQEYPSDYFMDNTHMNVAGRIDFSPKVATIVADNLIKGA